MRNELNKAISLLVTSPPDAYAFIYGSQEYQKLSGTAYFYSLWSGTMVLIDVDGLPYDDLTCQNRCFPLHIHEGYRCTGSDEDAFADTGKIYHPQTCMPPVPSGRLLPLLGNHGYAFSLFYTDSFLPEEIIGRTLVIHSGKEYSNLQTQKNLQNKIGCGVIMENTFSETK